MMAVSRALHRNATSSAGTKQISCYRACEAEYTRGQGASPLETPWPSWKEGRADMLAWAQMRQSIARYKRKSRWKEKVCKVSTRI